MEIFHEIYSAYFQVVRKILLESAKAPLTTAQMKEISHTYAFEESFLSIIPKLTEGPWSSLLAPAKEKSWRCALSSVSRSPHPLLRTPLTKLQKAWLCSLLSDPRFRLFFSEEELDTLSQMLSETDPLYLQEDFHYYDRFLDGDPYEDSGYRSHFRTILSSLCRCPLFVAYEGAKSGGNSHTLELLPCRLQYSDKNNRFRLLAVSLEHGRTGRFYQLNVSRILACHPSKSPVPKGFDWDFTRYQKTAPQPVQIRISQERNALERCMLHFASYEKQTVYEPDTDTYLCSIYYDPSDETELLIQLLSFGPVIRILGPESFLAQVRQRVKRQHELFYERVD